MGGGGKGWMIMMMMMMMVMVSFDVRLVSVLSERQERHASPHIRHEQHYNPI